MPTEGCSNTTSLSVPDLLDRERLMRRWQHGSEAFFWRHERKGQLTALSDGQKVRYAWEDVFAFEGGPPPEGMVEAYKADLLTAQQAASLCSVRPSYIISAAKKGDLPARRIGRAYRFVPAEVAAWRKKRFVNRKCKKKHEKSGSE